MGNNGSGGCHTQKQSRRAQGRLFVCICASFFGASSSAMDYTSTVRGRSMMRVEDNILGASSSTQEAWGFDTGANVNLSARSETFQSDLIPKVNVRRFAVGSSFDADEYSVAFNNRYFAERWTSAVDFSYAKDSTLTSEATVTGTVNNVTDRDSIVIRPSGSYLIADNLSIQSSVLINLVSYANAESSGFIDYNYIQGVSALEYMWRPDINLNISFFVSDFDTPAVGSSTRSYGGSVGGTWELTDSVQLTGSVGWIESYFSFDVVPAIPLARSGGGPTATFSMKKEFETTDVQFDYTRQVSPTSRGAQSEADKLELTIRHRMSSRLNLEIDTVYDMQTSQSVSGGLGQIGTELNRDYLEFRGTLHYRLSAQWGLGCSYRHGHRTSPNIFGANTADTNAAFFTVEYNGQPKNIWGGF